MQAKKRTRVPSYRRHKAKDLAAVTINGKHIYLGPYDSPESWERYHQEVAKWHAEQAGGPPPKTTVSPSGDSFLGVNNLVEAYLAFAEQHYAIDEQSSETTAKFACMVSAAKPLTDVFGLTNACDFGPKKLKLVREHMIGLKWSRDTINKCVSRIKRIFKWAVAGRPP